MNRKGFTLIELLAVIAIIGIIGLIAVPNMIGISDDIKKDNMLDDAKKLISLAKVKVSTDYEIKTFIKSGTCTGGTQCTLMFSALNTNDDVSKDPDNGDYVAANSYVRYYKSGTVIKYCIHLESSKRIIGKGNTCIDEANLFSKTSVQDK